MKTLGNDSFLQKHTFQLQIYCILLHQLYILITIADNMYQNGNKHIKRCLFDPKFVPHTCRHSHPEQAAHLLSHQPRAQRPELCL